MLSCEFQNMQIAEFFLNFARNLSVEYSPINQYTLPSPLPTGQNWPLGNIFPFYLHGPEGNQGCMTLSYSGPFST